MSSCVEHLPPCGVPVVPITDPADTRLSAYRDLTDVALRTRFEPETGMYIAESAAVIERAVEAGHHPLSIVMDEVWLDRMMPLVRELGADEPDGTPVYVGNRQVLESLTGFHVHRGALAAMARPTLPHWQEIVEHAQRIVILEDIVDHTNVGAIFRSAAGLGMDAVLVTPRCADPLYRRSVRVSMGTVFQVPWTRIEPWPAGAADLRAQGFTVAALTPYGDGVVSLDDFLCAIPPRVALIMGTEGDGIATPTLDHVDVRVSIPMSGGVDSLNVAAASAVAFWSLRR